MTQNKKTLVCFLFVLFLPIFSGQKNRKRDQNSWWRRLNMPDHTILKIEPSLEFLGPDNDGILSSAAITLPFKFKFDKLGWPSIWSVVKNSIYPGPGFQLVKRRRQRRSTFCHSHRLANGTTPSCSKESSEQLKGQESSEQLKGQESSEQLKGQESNELHDFYHPGGERASLFDILIKRVDSLGFNVGKPCVLRLICEIHQEPLTYYGLFGEMLTLLFTVSKSRLATTKHLKEYLEAERWGQRGQCEKYEGNCMTSIFRRHYYSDYSHNLINS